MFTNFELWDAKNPTVRSTPPSSGTFYHRGIVATKATLIEVLKAGYVSSIEDWEEHGPVLGMSRVVPTIGKLRSKSGLYLPDGRTVSSKIGMKSKVILNGFRK